MGTNLDFLMHHGIKGQKWGVRRFQNPDGSLTTAGKKRYSKDLYKELKKSRFYSTQDMVNRFAKNKAIQGIRNDPELVKARETLKNTSYNGDTSYDAFTDPKVISKAKEMFSRDMGRDMNPDNYRDEKLFGHYLDDAADQLGAYKKQERLERDPKWDKAYDAYTAARKKAISNVLGKYGDEKVNTFSGRGYDDVKGTVNDIISMLEIQS